MSEHGIFVFKLFFQTLTYFFHLFFSIDGTLECRLGKFVNDSSTKFSNCIMQKLVVNDTTLPQKIYPEELSSGRLDLDLC